MLGPCSETLCLWHDQQQACATLIGAAWHSNKVLELAVSTWMAVCRDAICEPRPASSLSRAVSSARSCASTRAAASAAAALQAGKHSVIHRDAPYWGPGPGPKCLTQHGLQRSRSTTILADGGTAAFRENAASAQELCARARQSKERRSCVTEELRDMESGAYVSAISSRSSSTCLRRGPSGRRLHLQLVSHKVLRRSAQSIEYSLCHHENAMRTHLRFCWTMTSTR